MATGTKFIRLMMRCHYGSGITHAAVLFLGFFTMVVCADESPRRARVEPVNASVNSNRDDEINIRKRGTPLNEMRRVGKAVRSFRVPRGVFHTPLEFWNIYGETLGLGPDDRMVPLPGDLAVQPIGHCQTHRYRQYHRDVAVLHGFYHLVACMDHVVAGLGEIRPSLTVDTMPRLKPNEALQAANRAVIRGLPGAQAKSSAPAQLVIYVPKKNQKSKPLLVYRIPMMLRDPLGAFEVLIDAVNGNLVRKRNLSRLAWKEISTNGQSVYDGNVNFLAKQNDSGAIHLEYGTTVAIQTRNAKGQSTLASSEHIVINSPTTSDQIKRLGISAHWAAQGVWGYFLDRHAWHGIDNLGEGLRVFIDMQKQDFGPTDAGWFGPGPFNSEVEWQIIALGVGDGIKSNPLVHPEILAHEMTHAIQYYQIGFLQGFESDTSNPDAGGLAESYADIFAVLAESYIRQTGVDYLIGNEWNLTGDRKMYNPANSIPTQPMKYHDAVWNAGLASPKTTIHFYSGPHSRWFYLLAEGEPQQLVRGIGHEQAAEIFFYAMTQLLFPTAQYIDALDAEKLSAETLFGQHTQPVALLLDAALIAGVGPGYINNLIYQPSDQTQGVQPWPVELAWEALGDEVQWQIEISPSVNFDNDVIVRETEPINDGSLVQLVSLPSNKQPNLQANTQYFWRVRGRSSSGFGWQEWRVPISFKTDDKRVMPVSPWIEDKEEYHPWELPFTWQPVDQAENYELQVFQGPHNSPVNWHGPLLTPDPLSETTITLDVRVNREHTWRIRALGPEGDFGPSYGAWVAVPFTTNMPQVTLLEPLGGDPRYPWPTRLKWKKVIGADHYLIDLTDCDGVFKSSNPQSPLPCPVLKPGLNYDEQKLEPDETNFDLNVQPEWLHDNVNYWWQVRVIGPPPWYDEGDKPKPKGRWRVDGDDTLPKQIYPEFSFSNTQCIALNENITFEWDNVQNALGYRLRITELRSDSAQQPHQQNNFTFPLEHGQEIFAQTYGVMPVSPQSQTIPNVGAGPMNGGRHLGYWWHIESLGPDGYQGLRDIAGTHYFIESDTPVPMFEDGHQFALNDEVKLAWKSKHAPFADYLLHVYLGRGCLGLNLLPTALIHGNSPGKSSATIPTNDLEEGDEYSWSVTPAYYFNHSQCVQGPRESDCVWFRAPAPVCGNGKKEDDEQCDDGNLEEGDGCSSQCKKVLACGQQHGAAGGINNPIDRQPLDLGGNKGRVWITAQTYTIPDRLIFEYGNKVIYEIDCYGTGGEEVVYYDINGGNSTMYISVEPGCNDNIPSNGTQWAYTVSCVDDTSPLPDHTPE